MEKQPTLSVVTLVTQVVTFFEVCQTKCTLLEMSVVQFSQLVYKSIIKAVMIKKNYQTVVTKGCAP